MKNGRYKPNCASMEKAQSSPSALQAKIEPARRQSLLRKHHSETEVCCLALIRRTNIDTGPLTRLYTEKTRLKFHRESVLRCLLSSTGAARILPTTKFVSFSTFVLFPIISPLTFPRPNWRCQKSVFFSVKPRLTKMDQKFRVISKLGPLFTERFCLC